MSEKYEKSLLERIDEVSSSEVLIHMGDLETLFIGVSPPQESKKMFSAIFKRLRSLNERKGEKDE